MCADGLTLRRNKCDKDTMSILPLAVPRLIPVILVIVEDRRICRDVRSKSPNVPSTLAAE